MKICFKANFAFEPGEVSNDIRSWLLLLKVKLYCKKPKFFIRYEKSICLFNVGLLPKLLKMLLKSYIYFCRIIEYLDWMEEFF